MKVVPLVVLAYEGPGVRAYLGRMRMAGIRPSHVVLMTPSSESEPVKGVGRLLPRSVRDRCAVRRQEAANNYWSCLIWGEYRNLVGSVIESMGQYVEGAKELAEGMVRPFAYSDYCEKFDRVSASDLEDAKLAEHLRNMGPVTVLYTGGGAVPESLLEIEGLKWLHVHSGRLPNVRGEDGLLWSTMIDGHPSMSCLYLGEGLDRGQLISVKEYGPLRFEVGEGLRPDDETLYRVLQSFCDPILRAHTLVGELLSKYDNPAELAVIDQDSGEGTRHHFMHERIRHKALARVFRGGKTLDGFYGADMLTACPA